MGLFGTKKKKEEKKAPVASAPELKKAAKAEQVSLSADILLRPRVTEKAANMTSNNVYVFDVRKAATKKQVASAVATLYKVHPVKVRIVNIPAKRVAMRRKRGFGRVAAVKKAYVALKDGETITFA